MLPRLGTESGVAQAGLLAGDHVGSSRMEVLSSLAVAQALLSAVGLAAGLC